MQFELRCADGRPTRDDCPESVEVGQVTVPLRLVRNPQARRYILRLCPDGSARVTIPRGGSVAAARAFAGRQSAWLERQLQTLRNHPPQSTAWGIGSEFLFRGERVLIEACGSEGDLHIRFGTEMLCVQASNGDLRAAVEHHLWRLASHELPPRLMDYAAVHRLPVRKVTVRNQRTRWGSCSHRGTISLNWRLIQTPPFVRDYILLHELMHLREMNHSPRFWQQVESVCPYYHVAERWLKAHTRLLRE